MNRTFTFILFCLSFLTLDAQEFYISFRPADSATPIDSILVTNLRTNRKVRLAAADSLFLTQSPTESTTIYLGYTDEDVYPNPNTGEAWLRFYTPREEPVKISVFNASGQLLIREVQKLGPGAHRFRIKFPCAGLFFISVFRDKRVTGFKAVNTGNIFQPFSITHVESKEVNFSDSAALFKNVESARTMQFEKGDILYCSAFSGRENTILTDSPVERKVYDVIFHPCTDTGNRDYPVVKIGNQWWMAGNLAWLPEVTPAATGSETTSCYYVYGYNGTNVAEAKASPAYAAYGCLYNQTAAMGGVSGSPGHQRGVRGACPAGWHVPAAGEWDELSAFLGGANTAGGAMKATGTLLWESPNTGASNSSGFTALPGGARMNDKSFLGARLTGNFWTSTASSSSDASYRILYHQNTVFGLLSGNKSGGFSIRCVKDIPTNAIVITDQVTGITQNSAVCGGEVLHEGFAEVTERGIVWSETENPALSGTKISVGKGMGSFSGLLSGLTANTKYYVRAYAVNSQGAVYGEQISFITKPEITLPVVTTDSVTTFTRISATGGGKVTSDGYSPVTARGVCWNTTGNPTIADNKTVNGSGTGSFTSQMTGLTVGTTYFVRAYATNSVGTAYGEQVSFTTEPESTLPTVNTVNADSITARSALLGGEVTHDGYATVTERGVVYATTENPSVNDIRVQIGNGSGPFSIKVTGLTPKTLYYVRAYAINSLGTAYGEQLSFTTPCPAVDADGNCYNSVFIGNQEWMLENLRTTRYRDGTPIPLVSDNSEWISLTTGAFSWYDNNESNKNVNGALYNWYAAVNNHNLCPEGWHLPDDAEWSALITFLGGELVAGGKMKEAGTSHWNIPNTGATNSSGFTALPTGIRGGFGSFYNLGNLTYYWSSTSATTANAFVRALYHDSEDADKIPYPKSFGLSVRCLKDK